MAIYLDASAIGKLFFGEEESDHLTLFLRQRPARVSSALARVEVGRALARAQSRMLRHVFANQSWERIGLLAIDTSILAAAAVIGPPELRSLDAIHLATALSIPDLEGMVVYDRRLARAAQAAGLRVWAPGQNTA